MEYTPAAIRVKEGFRKVLREMVICGILLSIFFALIGKNLFTEGVGQGMLILVLTGLLCSPVLWLIYRGIRFVIGR